MFVCLFPCGIEFFQKANHLLHLTVNNWDNDLKFFSLMTAFWGWVVRMLAIIYDYDLSKLSVVPWGLVFRENFRKVSFPVTFSNVAVTGRGNPGSLESVGCNAVERSSQINLHKNGTTEAIWRKVVGSQGCAPLRG